MMSPTFLRLAPTSAVLSLVLYCVWTTDVSTSAPAGKTESTSPRLSRDLLNPPEVPSPARDPFNLQATKAREVKASVAKPRPAPPPAPAPVQAKKVEPKETKPEPVEVAKAKAVRRLPGLLLSGTSLGSQRLAVINNRIYSEGERLRGTGLESWVVAQIQPGRVQLRNGEMQAEVKFSSQSRRPVAETASPRKGES